MELINDAIKRDRGTIYCVYSLINDGVVIYVGSSRNISDRLRSHKYSDKVFDCVEIIECSGVADMFTTEAMLIIKFNPKHNKSIPYNDKYMKLVTCIQDSNRVITSLVKDLPTCFSKGNEVHIDADIYNEFISSVDDFALKKIADITRRADVQA